MKGLATAFKEVYADLFKEYGYKKVKGRYPYYVRVINDEVVHMLTISSRPTPYRETKAFAIYGGIATTYRHNINFERPVTRNWNWFVSNDELYCKDHPYEDYTKIREKWIDFTYRTDDEESMIEMLRYSLEVTKEVMIPVFEEVNSLESSYNFFEKYDASMLNVHVGEKNGILYSSFEYGEGMLNFLLFNSEQYIESQNQRTVKNREKENKQFELGILKYSQELREKMRKDGEKFIGIQIKSFTSMRDNPVEYTEVLEEAKRRKVHNIEILRGYGLDVGGNDNESNLFSRLYFKK